jgi:acyl-CoA-binding protein
MTEEELDKNFEKAVEYALEIEQTSLPQDVQLRLYAYYKQATFGSINYNQNSNFDLRNAFKTNAWLQISHLSVQESKALYIETINKIIEK